MLFMSDTQLKNWQLKKIKMFNTSHTTLHTTSHTELGLYTLDTLDTLDNSFHEDPLNEQLLHLFEQSIFGNVGADFVPPELHRLTSLTPLGLIPEPYPSDQRNPFEPPLIPIEEIEQLFDGDLFGMDLDMGPGPGPSGPGPSGPDMLDLLSVPLPAPMEPAPMGPMGPRPMETTYTPAQVQIDGILVTNLYSEPAPAHLTPIMTTWYEHDNGSITRMTMSTKDVSCPSKRWMLEFLLKDEF